MRLKVEVWAGGLAAAAGHTDHLTGVNLFSLLDQRCGGQVAVSGDGPISVLQFEVPTFSALDLEVHPIGWRRSAGSGPLAGGVASNGGSLRLADRRAGGHERDGVRCSGGAAVAQVNLEVQVWPGTVAR